MEAVCSCIDADISSVPAALSSEAAHLDCDDLNYQVYAAYDVLGSFCNSANLTNSFLSGIIYLVKGFLSVPYSSAAALQSHL